MTGNRENLSSTNSEAGPHLTEEMVRGTDTIQDLCKLIQDQKNIVGSNGNILNTRTVAENLQTAYDKSIQQYLTLDDRDKSRVKKHVGSFFGSLAQTREVGNPPRTYGIREHFIKLLEQGISALPETYKIDLGDTEGINALSEKIKISTSIHDLCDTVASEESFSDNSRKKISGVQMAHALKRSYDYLVSKYFNMGISERNAVDKDIRSLYEGDPEAGLFVNITGSHGIRDRLLFFVTERLKRGPDAQSTLENLNDASANEVISNEIAGMLGREFSGHAMEESIGGNAGSITVGNKNILCGAVNAVIDAQSGMIVQFGNWQHLDPEVRTQHPGVTFRFRSDTTQIIEVYTDSSISKRAMATLKTGITTYNNGLEPVFK